MTDNQNSNKSLGVNLKTTDKDESPEKSSRRKFLAAAAVSTPLMMSSLSKPAWGGGLGNRLCWSGIQSGNVSREPELNCNSGATKNSYKNNISGWPASVGILTIDHGLDSTQYDTNGRIHDAVRISLAASGPGDFQGTLFNNLFVPLNRFTGLTLLQVLWQHPAWFASHAIATVFNTVQFVPYVWDTSTALEISNACLEFGSYTDSMGRNFSRSDMKDIFKGQYGA